jgi:hypothetical protein
VKKIAYFFFSILVLSLAVGCGGGSSSSGSGGGGTGTSGTGTNGTTSVAGGNQIVTSGNNVAPLVVDAGLDASNPTANVAYTTIVICAPGTSNCVTLDHVMVDTGSVGLRVPASAFSSLANGANVLAALQNVNPSAPVAECYSFISDTYFWGSVKAADVKMGGSSNTSELASSVPIQVIGDPSLSAAPSGCVGSEEDGAFGTNGLLGVGNFQYDCDELGVGNPCTSTKTVPPGLYYTCSGANCSTPVVPTTEQVRNPVSLFATDNNGVILELPEVASAGAAGETGGLVFGIGTESNNGLSSSATVLTLDPNESDPAWMGVTTVYNGVSYPNSTAALGSFLDSGSNGIFFLDQPTSGIPDCGDWYCPNSTESLTAVNQATGGNSREVAFDVANADTLFSSNNIAFSNLAGPNTSGTPGAGTQADDAYFDWGLSFFYGRNIYTGIWGVTPPATPVSGSSVPAGPYWAY